MAKRQRPKYKQGIYVPKYPAKCVNSVNKKPIEYRSQLEFEYMYKLDHSPNIRSWGSEVVWVPYMHPFKKRVCQYWTDLILDSKKFGVLVVEIKPEKEIKAIMENKVPKATARKKQSTLIYETKMFQINKAKWIAAKEYCETKGWKFIQLSEKDLKEGKVPFF